MAHLAIILDNISTKVFIIQSKKILPSKLIHYTVAKLGIIANILNWDHIMTHKFVATLCVAVSVTKCCI